MIFTFFIHGRVGGKYRKVIFFPLTVKCRINLIKQRFPSCSSPDDLLVLILGRLTNLSPRFRNVWNISPFLGRHSPPSDIQLGKMSCGHYHGAFSHFRGPNRKKKPLPKCRIDLGLLFEGCIRLEEKIRN